MRYLHTMVRVRDLDESLDFYCRKLGLREVRRVESQQGRYTLVYLSAPKDEARAKADSAPLLELTYNWDPEEYTGGRNFGYLAFQVDDIYALCGALKDAGTTINRPPRDGRMAFIRSPRRHLHRVAAGRSRLAAARAVGKHGQYGDVVAGRAGCCAPPGRLAAERAGAAMRPRSLP